MKRLLLYVHYNKHNQLSSHVLYQLSSMRSIFSKVIFISNSLLLEEKLSVLQSDLVDDIIQRENIGFDFAAWRDGIESIGYEELLKYDSITLMNDTCFGPIFDVYPIFKQFESDHSIDFWGMTNNRETHLFNEHIQSYFISFSRKVVSSRVFRDFWENVKIIDDVQSVIYEYEAKLTKQLTDAGFEYRVVFDTSKEELEQMPHPDFTYYNPTKILQKGVPFLKVKAIVGNPIISPFLFDEIERISDYPVDLIVNHISMIYSPVKPYLLSRKYLERLKIVKTDLSRKKIAIHLHVFYVDLLDEFLSIFKSYSFEYDLFITTNTQKKYEEIERILSDYSIVATIKITGNIGRDILPMLGLAKDLEQYDYVGHFHTKKSKEADYWAGQSWRTELIDMLVKPAEEILYHLASKEELGIIIADIPSYFRYVKMDPEVELEMLPWMKELWQRMDLSKDTVFCESDVFVMSYGTYVWFKYDALKPLFELELSKDEIPNEPLPQNTILHAIERMLVYISWAQGYDFRIVENHNHLTPFIDNQVINKREISSPVPIIYKNFNRFGGLKAAGKYMFTSIYYTSKYIVKKLILKVLKRDG